MSLTDKNESFLLKKKKVRSVTKYAAFLKRDFRLSPKALKFVMTMPEAVT